MIDRCKRTMLTVELCEHAVMDAFHGKWWRRTTMNELNKYGGVTDAELRAGQMDGNNLNPRLEGVYGVACEMFLRAAIDLEQSCRIPLFRCRRLVSYNGQLENSNSRKAQEKLRTAELIKIAKETISTASRLRAWEQKGYCYDIQKRTEQHETGRCENGVFA